MTVAIPVLSSIGALLAAIGTVVTALGGAAQLDAKYTKRMKKQPDVRKSLRWGVEQAVEVLRTSESRRKRGITLSSDSREDGGVALRFFGSLLGYLAVLLGLIAWSWDHF